MQLMCHYVRYNYTFFSLQFLCSFVCVLTINVKVSIGSGSKYQTEELTIEINISNSVTRAPTGNLNECDNTRLF